MCECERSSFQSIRNIQENDGFPTPQRFKTNFQFVRSGQNEQWRDVFHDDDLVYYQELCDEFGNTFYPNVKSTG